MLTNLASNLALNGGTNFRIKRPPITTSGFVSDVDAHVKTYLDELNTLLSKRFLHPTATADDVIALLNRQLTPKHVPPVAPEKSPKGVAAKEAHVMKDTAGAAAATAPAPSAKLETWDPASLAAYLDAFTETSTTIALSDYIDRTADLSNLKYDFMSNLAAGWYGLDYNTKAVLDGYPAITDFLITYGFHIMNVTEVNGLQNFIFSNKAGAKTVATYAAVSAARFIVNDEQLNVLNYNQDDSDIVAALKDAALSLSTNAFASAAKAVIDDYLFNGTYLNIIKHAKVGVVTPAMQLQLVKFLKNSPVPIDNTNVNYFLPLFISQIQAATPVTEPTEVDSTISDQDFSVDVFVDDNAIVQVSRSAVLCAAQLYYGMIMGDELDIFDTVNYFTHKYLIRGGIEVQDSRLREDLQNYVFSNRFNDVKTNKLQDRTRAAERQMFYRQVFNYGNAQITDDVVVNYEFTKLWKVLMLESARYLERAQASPNPESYVSRQNVMQAVEDLQYNLSTHCTGMANVISPLIHSELNFVVRRILMNNEVIRQIVPAGGTWWRVVETLYMGMRNVRPKSTVLYNKAKLGHDILASIADYNPSTFEQDGPFSAFISQVDAFITTQSILQEGLTDDLKGEQEEDDAKATGVRPPARDQEDTPSAATPVGSKTGTDEWDF